MKAQGNKTYLLFNYISSTLNVAGVFFDYKEENNFLRQKGAVIRLYKKGKFVKVTLFLFQTGGRTCQKQCTSPAHQMMTDVLDVAPFTHTHTRRRRLLYINRQVRHYFVILCCSAAGKRAVGQPLLLINVSPSLNKSLGSSAKGQIWKQFDLYSLSHLQIICFLGTNATFAAAALQWNVFFLWFTTMLMKIFIGRHRQHEHPMLSLSTSHLKSFMLTI